jgi:hypothetical protein
MHTTNLGGIRLDGSYVGLEALSGGLRRGLQDDTTYSSIF